MIKKWLSWINLLVSGLAITLVVAGLGFLLFRVDEIPVLTSATVKSDLPKGAFTLSKEAYDHIGEPLLSLQYSPMTMQLPDLKKYLIYYGKNGRPDANPELPMMHFSFSGNKAPYSVLPGQRLYLVYDRQISPPQYVFSEGNAETPLWIEASSQGADALVKVGLRDENGQTIAQPAAYAQFTLPEKEYVRVGGASWEIGKWRVDGTLLARQRARWFGADRFLEKHGGEEYKDFAGKQRLDFGEGEETYSVYIGPNDALMWDKNQDRWMEMKPGVESLGHPLMVVKRIDERLMNLELWDVEGKGKLVINLLKTNEAWTPQNIQQGFKFVGAKTRSQFVFEIDEERMLLRPQDWIVMTEDGWRKLVTAEDVDEYVERKIVGPLFVFDGVIRKDDHQVLVGTVFNAARTEMQPIELVAQQLSNPNSLDKSKIDDNIKNGEQNPETPYAKSRGGNPMRRE